MKLVFTFIVITIICSQNSFAVVISHNVPEAAYEVSVAPDYLIDMPHEGHGVLVASNWVLTVGHTIFYDYVGKEIEVAGELYQITDVIFHPDYKPFPENFNFTNRKELKQFLFNRSDVALIQLSSDIRGLSPIKLYNNSDEQSKIIEVYGRGATGNGLTGMIIATKEQKKLRYFHNTILKADENWLFYRFDPPKAAIPLEGIHGSGDSGGPSVIYQNKIPYLVGLSSWQTEGDEGEYSPMLYGTTAYQVRVSKYIKWIESIIHKR
ncbi:MAG: trypsin-like serine protease [Kordiimonadaceae bacterium]|jgi:hypothetical protein|nr:trypsin-like serine protease [Kordiimonadaceae bacterium]MBT6036117.1 trypsin-like serine protease [Kordiimonadaceae bacterium]MBT6329902.1 trypsin-like serine protease [Kordiimonadaceae bacterium]MBT7582092.1 trypsin-like serine protease [Kordiimonadaceae bacterium]